MKSNKGFSLIEMMITVAILGILAAIAVPAYQGYIKNGKCAQVKGPVHSVMVDLVGDFAENGGADETVTSAETLTIDARTLEMPEKVKVGYSRVSGIHTVWGERADDTVCDGARYELKENDMEGEWKN